MKIVKKARRIADSRAAERMRRSRKATPYKKSYFSMSSELSMAEMPIRFAGMGREDGFGEGDAAVLTAGAANGNGEVAFAFLLIEWDEKVEKIVDFFKKIAGVRVGEDVIGDGLIASGEGGEFGDEEGIFEESGVEDEIGVGRESFFEAEADDGDGEGMGLRGVSSFEEIA